MSWTVTYRPSARDELTEVWLNSPDRFAVTAAANKIDQLLRSDPLSCGESRDNSKRVLLVPPLTVFYDVIPDDQMVIVWNIFTFGN
jgi:hypothetical protein